MEQQSDIPVIKNTSVFLQKRNAVVPIDLDWRKKYYRAVLGRRTLAFILDYFTTFVIATIPAVIIFPVRNNETTELCTVFQLVFFVLLCAFMESSKWQGSFGKRIMKIQITNSEGYSISFPRALLRNLLRIVVGYSYCFIIPLIIQIFRFRKTKKLFHDEISHTIIGERLG
jgi:uncharacterized RDD family membrane protein YckC